MFNIMYPSIYSSVYPSIYLSMYLSIHLSMYPSTYLSIYLCIYLYVHLSIQFCSNPSIHLSICVSIHLSIHISSYTYTECVPNPSKYYKKPYQDESGRPLAQHGSLWVTFGTLRLHLGPIWGVLVAFLVSLGTLETPGPILECLEHLNTT